MKYKITPLGFTLILLLILMSTYGLSSQSKEASTLIIRELRHYDHRALEGQFSLKTEGDIINLSRKAIDFTFIKTDDFLVTWDQSSVLLKRDHLVFNEQILYYYDLYKLNTAWLHLDESIERFINNPFPRKLLLDYSPELSDSISPYLNKYTMTLSFDDFFELLTDLNAIYKKNEIYEEWLIKFVRHYYNDYASSIHGQMAELIQWQDHPGMLMESSIETMKIYLQEIFQDKSYISMTIDQGLKFDCRLFYKHCDAYEHLEMTLYKTDSMIEARTYHQEMNEENLEELMKIIKGVIK